jgi:adenylate cyclase
MNSDEPGTLATLTACREIIDGLIVQHRGRIANTAGDSVLAEFPSAVYALKCAVTAQQQLAAQGADIAESERLLFRIGVHVGDVLLQGGDLLGDAVNVAARLEKLAEPGGVCISAAVHEYVRHALPLNFEDLGSKLIKNIADPIHAFSIRPANAKAKAQPPNEPPLVVPDRPSIGVIPFTTSHPEDDYLVEGICDDVITSLYKMRWLFVIARNSTFPLKGQAIEVTDIARRLGVSYLLTGSLRRSGNRVRVTCQLVEGATGGSLWAERYDRDLTDAFALQDEIAEQVAAAIEPELLKKEGQRVGSRPIKSLAAWDLVRRGTWEFHKVTPETARTARDLFKQAIAADPTSPDGYLWLARTHGQILAYYRSDEGPELVRDGLAAAQRAVQLDDKNPYCHYALAIILNVSGRSSEAARAAERCISLCPSFALGYFALGFVSLAAGRAPEAIEALDKGLRLNPHDPQGFSWHLNLSMGNYFLGKADAALDHAKRALSLRPNWAPAFLFVGLCLSALDRTDEARHALAEMDAAGDAFVGQVAVILGPNPHWSEAVQQRLAELRVGWSSAGVSVRD